LAYRITPFMWNQTADVDKMYDNMMNRFRFGNVSWEGIYLDETNMRMCRTHRHMMALLAKALLAKGDKTRAANVLAKAKKELPFTTIPIDVTDLDMGDMWLQLGNKRDAANVYAGVARQSMAKLRWMDSFGEDYVFESLGDECYRELQIGTMALDGLKEADAKLHASLNSEFERIAQTAAGRSGLNVIQQQMQQQQQQAAPVGGDASPFGF